MTSRCRNFDSALSDAPRVHRLPYQQNCGAIHAIGNGRIMAYGRGCELMQLFSPYSCPTLCSLVTAPQEHIVSQTCREQGANIWVHQLRRGLFYDCAPRGTACFVRRWRLNAPVRFVMDFHGFSFAELTRDFSGCAFAGLIWTPQNAPAYNDYPINRECCMAFAAQGGFECAPCEEGLLVSFSGEGSLRFCGGEGYCQAAENLRAALRTPCAELFESCAREERAFNARREARMGALRDHPLVPRVRAAAEDVAMLLRAQQSEEGGIQAGHNYHLAYVRDMYGDFRGLLALGCHEEALSILRFYRGVFERNGVIHNAQGMGVERMFHVHEDDRSEITGYLIHQALLMARVIGDWALFDSLTPMLDWALRMQLEALNNSMLPFNGDETYVAGGFLPRTALNHGSFEATALLLSAAPEYIEARRRRGCAEEWMQAAQARLAQARAAFERNFRRGDTYVTNSLARLDGLNEPEYRHGVCVNEHGYFGWTRRIAPGYYVCPACVSTGRMDKAACEQEYCLKSTLLMAPYIHSDLISAGFIRTQTAGFLDLFRTRGQLPSLPDGDRCLGYDFGLLLYAAAQSGLQADDLLLRMLDLQDECGAWAEYYKDGVASNTRCRPWESAINIEGALAYLAR